MVEDRTTDGKRIAQLLSSEVSSREDSGLAALEVVNADPDVEPSADGELAYEIARSVGGEEGVDEAGVDEAGGDEAGGDEAGGDEAGGDDAETLAEVYVHDDRARIEFRDQVDAAAAAAEDAGLRVRPKAVRPPRTLVFVEDGAEVKRATDVVAELLQSVEDRR